MSFVELREVRKVHHAGRPDEVVALRGVTADVEAGAVTVLRGPSGSGKSSLLSIIGCMARPTSGRAFVDGREVTSLPEHFLTEIRRRTFGFVFQQFHLLAGISVLENVMLPAYPLGESRAALLRRAGALLELLRLEGRARARADWLSGGEAQRAAIARALINDPRALVADEPTAHLDSRLAGELMEVLAELRRRGKAVIVASHDPLVCNSPLVDRVVALRDGRIAQAAP
jgi:putative ABC transport system ATP-binding protein